MQEQVQQRRWPAKGGIRQTVQTQEQEREPIVQQKIQQQRWQPKGGLQQKIEQQRIEQQEQRQEQERWGRMAPVV